MVEMTGAGASHHLAGVRVNDSLPNRVSHAQLAIHMAGVTQVDITLGIFFLGRFGMVGFVTAQALPINIRLMFDRPFLSFQLTVTARFKTRVAGLGCWRC